MYLDINCTNFPFDQGLFAHRETVGEEYQLDLGGSALNFAKIAAQLDIDVSFLGKAGHDGIGGVLTTLFQQNNINPLLVFEKDIQTNLAIHYIHADGSSIMTSCGNANQSLGKEDIEPKLDELFDTVGYLYLGGVFKLKKLLPYLKEIAKKAKDKGITVVLDHGRVNNSVTKKDLEHLSELFPYIDIYLPSMDEFLTVWKADTPQEAFTNLCEIAQPITIIKHAENGAIGFYEEKEFYADPYKVEVMNTVGAGDSFNAGFLKAQIEGMTVEESMQFACAVAALKISTTEKITVVSVNQLRK